MVVFSTVSLVPEFKVVDSSPQRSYFLCLEKMSFPKPQMFPCHWRAILEICVLDHKKELVKGHGEIRPILSAGEDTQKTQCHCLLPSNGGGGGEIEGR